MTNKLTVEQVDRENAADLSWFIRNGDRSNPCAFINTNPNYFADECATYFSHRQQAEARAEGLVEALEKIEVMDTDYTLGPDHNLERARDIAAKALTAYRSARP